MQASNPMTFSQFVALLPDAFGEENPPPIDAGAFDAIEHIGIARYTTRSGFRMTVEKCVPEGRCAVRLRANIARVIDNPQARDTLPLKTLLPFLQYAISSYKLSCGANNTVTLQRQVPLFDLTPARVENEIAQFCKNCFCALTMLEYSECPIVQNDDVRRVVMSAYTAPGHFPTWEKVPPTTPDAKPQGQMRLTMRVVQPERSAHGDSSISGGKPDQRAPVLPLSAASNTLSHIHPADEGKAPEEHVKDWRTLQKQMSYLLGETAANVRRAQVFYDAAVTGGFWYQMQNGVDLYLHANPYQDGDGDITISARLKTLQMNPAGAEKISAFINAYNASSYVGTLSLDIDSTVTLWRAMNLASSGAGEVKRSLREFAAAISDLDLQLHSMSNYVKLPSYPYVKVKALSRPAQRKTLPQPSFQDCLLFARLDFGEHGKFAELDLPAIRSIDVTVLGAAAVRDICLTRLTRFNFHWGDDDMPVLIPRKKQEATIAMKPTVTTTTTTTTTPQPPPHSSSFTQGEKALHGTDAQ